MSVQLKRVDEGAVRLVWPLWFRVRGYLWHLIATVAWYPLAFAFLGAVGPFPNPWPELMILAAPILAMVFWVPRLTEALRTVSLELRKEGRKLILNRQVSIPTTSCVVLLGPGRSRLPGGGGFEVSLLSPSFRRAMPLGSFSARRDADSFAQSMADFIGARLDEVAHITEIAEG